MARNTHDKRGLASADKKTREEVARKGGKAYHEKRGSHGTDHNS
ncbi:MAG TPA: hypothetical protein VFN56_03530 [Candidatus Saccharimonadales bacterium]|nr:hypothetical protein [Candidatus Saccharimonadales bacterium]